MATVNGMKIMGEKATVKMCEGVSEDYGINMILHLDHCQDYDMIRRCVDNGFRSVMIDASSKSYQKNVDIACPDGTFRIEGPGFQDLDIAMAAKHTISAGLVSLIADL